MKEPGELPTVGEIQDWLAKYDRSYKVQGISDHGDDGYEQGLHVFEPESMDCQGFFKT